MKKNLDTLIDVLSLSDDDQSKQLALHKFAQQCGFEHYAYVNIRPSLPEVFTDYPRKWTDIYFANRYQRIDPVIASAKRMRRPFYWSSLPLHRASTAAERRFYAHARQFGIVSGLSIPIGVALGRTAVLTLASHLPDFKGEGKLDDIQAITATTLLYALLKRRDPSTMAEPQIHLTVREKQCLYWLAVGKSLSLTADILEIKKDTVRHYLKLARGKLGADNTINAVHVATRLGLI